MEIHSVANLATLQTPLATFIPLVKKVPSDKSLGFAQALFSFWDSLVLPHEREVLLSQHARTPLSLSLSLSLSLCASALFSERQRGAVLSVKHKYYVASLILHASIAEIIAQLLSLSYVYLISSDDGSITRIFVQINSVRESWLCRLNGSRFS